MCGIFGFDLAGLRLTHAQRVALTTTLTLCNDDRGGQGWGYAFYTKEGNVEIKRGLGEVAPKTLQIANKKINLMMGHARYATHGSKKQVKNCHPFEFQNIIGAHNGMLDGHDWINLEFNRKFKVDSMHLFAHLSEGRNFSELCGYGSIEWIDSKKPGRIHLCKMQGGQLSVWGIRQGKDKECKGVIWSSDAKHAELALRVAGLKKNSFAYQVTEGMVFSVHSGQLWKTDQQLLFGEQYDRSWRLGSVTKSSKPKKSKKTKKKQRNQTNVFGTNSHIDTLYGHNGWTLTEEEIEELEELEELEDKFDELISCEFDGGACEELVYKSEIDMQHTYYDRDRQIYCTSESLDEFLQRNKMDLAVLDRRYDENCHWTEEDQYVYTPTGLLEKR